MEAGTPGRISTRIDRARAKGVLHAVSGPHWNISGFHSVYEMDTSLFLEDKGKAFHVIRGGGKSGSDRALLIPFTQGRGWDHSNKPPT